MIARETTWDICQLRNRGISPAPSNKEAFAFVQDLALEMSAGKIEIPSFPDVAVRIRKVLADENCTPPRSRAS